MFRVSRSGKGEVDMYRFNYFIAKLTPSLIQYAGPHYTTVQCTEGLCWVNIRIIIIVIIIIIIIMSNIV